MSKSRGTTLDYRGPVPRFTYLVRRATRGVLLASDQLICDVLKKDRERNAYYAGLEEDLFPARPDAEAKQANSNKGLDLS